MTIVGVQLIDRIGRRRLLFWGAAGMCLCEFIVAIVSCLPCTVMHSSHQRQVGVTAGHINGNQAVNVPAQRVLIAFVCM